VTGSLTFRRSRYRGTPAASLRHRACARVATVAALTLLALPAGGCSFSYQLGSLFGEDDSPTQTASIASTATTKPAAAPLDGDLVFARAAAVDLLARGGRVSSVPWTNPRTGARGTVTPVADSYTQDGLECRDFLASYERAGSEGWLEGEACHQEGKWEVRKLRPLKRS